MKRKTFFFLSVIGAAALGSSPARAAEKCYDFSGLQDDRVFAIGETYEAEHLRAVFRPYVLPSGGKTSGTDYYAKVQSTDIAKSKSTELSEIYLYGVNMQIVPRQPVAQIRFRVAENKGNSLGRHFNIAIGDKVHQISTSLRELEDRVVEDEAGRQFRINVKLTHNPPDADGTVSKWYSGTMQVRALAGQITSFSIGGHPMVVDDVCITPNAP